MPTGISAINALVSVPELPQPSSSCPVVNLLFYAGTFSLYWITRDSSCSFMFPFWSSPLDIEHENPGASTGSKELMWSAVSIIGEERWLYTLWKQTQTTAGENGHQESHQKGMPGHAGWWFVVYFVPAWQIMKVVSQNITDQSPRIRRETFKHLKWIFEHDQSHSKLLRWG